MADFSEDNSTADMPPSDPVFAPGSHPMDVGRLGKYRVLKQLGKGGMGAVYLGYDPQLQRKVALKVMLPKYAASSEARRRFLREARAAAKINSDHVVTIHDIGEEGGIPFFALEYLQGRPLDDFLKEKGAPNIAQAMRIGREVAAGLAAAHALGLIHRDIKPGNLWLEAPKGRVKILDFGLAKLTTPEGNPAQAELTQIGQAIGTPAYMSPEQARGAKVDHRTDLFSLGSVLYRLLTGRLPFPGSNQVEVLMKVTMEEPRPIREINPRVPERVADLVHRLLAKDPAARVARAEEVIAALAKNDGSKEGASGPGSVQTVYVPIAISPQPESIFAGIDESSTEVVTPEGGETPVVKPKKLPPEPKPVSRWWLIGSALAVIGLVVAAGVTWRLMRSTPSPPPPEEQKSVPLPPPPVPRSDGSPFNGKDLSGWKFDTMIWRVDEKGQIVGTNTTKTPKHLYTDRAYSDFEWSFQIQFPEDRLIESNVRFRSLLVKSGGRIPDPVTLTFRPNTPLQFQGEAAPQRTRAVGVPKAGTFSTIAIRVIGNRVTVLVNGEVMVEDELLALPGDGVIGWTLGPNESVVIRDVRLTDITARERSAAEKLLMYSSIDVTHTGTGVKTSVAQNKSLPAGPFTVTRIHNPKPTDIEEFFATLGELRFLKSFEDYAQGLSATPHVLARIADLPTAASIENLHLPSFSLTVDAIESIKKFPRLTSLHLYAGSADDAVLTALAAAVPSKLSGLNLHMLHQSRITPVGLRKLLALPLTSLHVSAPKGFGAQFGSTIAEFPLLTNLAFGAATIEDLDAALGPIAGCPKLESLTLYAVCPVRDAHLLHLKPLATLRTLTLKNTPTDMKMEVTEAGAKELAKDLPKCRIIGDRFTVEPSK